MVLKCHLTWRTLTTLPSEKNGSVDVTFACATTHQKHLAQSGCSLGGVRGVQWTFSIHSAYLLKSQSENKKFSWMNIQQTITQDKKKKKNNNNNATLCNNNAQPNLFLYSHLPSRNPTLIECFAVRYYNTIPITFSYICKGIGCQYTT